MRVALVSYKGGCGKTTSAVHLAAFLQQKAPTILIDGDPNRSASAWNQRGENGKSLPFAVIDERTAARTGAVRDYEHVVIDTEARPKDADLRDLAEQCDALIVPTSPDALSLDALKRTLDRLRGIESDNFQVLLTIVPPKPSRDADEARAVLEAQKIKVLKGQIHRLVAFQKAALAGVPVYDVSDARAAVAWADYESIGREILRA